MRTPPEVAIRRLAVARFISVTGSMAAYTALIDLVYRETDGSTLYLSLTILLTIGAAGLFEPVGAVVADHWDRKKALIWSDLIGTSLFALLTLTREPAALLGVALLTAIAETPFRAGSVAAIPNLVDDDRLIAKANGWIGVGSNLGITVGPALGGLLVAWVGASPVFLLNAGSFVLSAGLIWSIRAPFSGAPEEAEEGDSGFTAGFRFLRRDRVLLVVTLSWMVLLLGMGLGIVSDRPVAEIFDAGAVGFGVMLGLWGLGSVLGSVIASRMTARTEPVSLVVGFVLAGIGGIGIGVAPVFWLVLGCNFVWGLGDALTVVAEQGIIQRRTPDAIRSRVVGANESLVHVALMAGFLAAGPVLAAVGPQATYAIGGVAALLAGALANTVRSGAMPGPGEPEPSHAERPVAPWE
jgi:predicted MFS family arabinose efflux permease